MEQYEVTIRVVVNADSDYDAYHTVEYAVESLVKGNIVEASVKSVDELA
jgi:hypothetical protein